MEFRSCLELGFINKKQYKMGIEQRFGPKTMAFSQNVGWKMKIAPPPPSSGPSVYISLITNRPVLQCRQMRIRGITRNWIGSGKCRVNHIYLCTVNFSTFVVIRSLSEKLGVNYY